MFRVSVGTSALSAFRLEKLRAALNALTPNVVIVHTRHCYFSALNSKSLSPAQTKLMDKVLGLDGTAGAPKQSAELTQVLVVPRLGTISPWSTKATDIAQHCGLDALEEI